MAIIKPFKALRPQPQFAKQVASKPYDVLNSSEAKKEAEGNPNSFLHITKSEIDLSENTYAYSNEVYEQAKNNLAAFIKRNILFKEDKNCFYIYRLADKTHTQTGLVALSSIDDYNKNIIKKHELTKPEKELDRINHIKTTGAQTGNVFLTYKTNTEIDEIINLWTAKKTAVYAFIADDNITHSLWIINDDKTIDKITKIFGTQIEHTYIADGHHRAASAAKVAQENGNDSQETNFFLTTLFPSGQLRISAYNRIIKTLHGLMANDFISDLKNDFYIEKKPAAYTPEMLHSFGLYIDDCWYKLTAKPGTYLNNQLGSLDITILQNNILSKYLGIYDQRTDKNIDFVGGTRGLEALENFVNSGEYVMAFSLFPVTIEQLFAIADSNSIMPPKSTWFEPKLRDGLVTHLTHG